MNDTQTDTNAPLTGAAPAAAPDRPVINTRLIRQIVREIECDDGHGYNQSQPYMSDYMEADPDAPGRFTLYRPMDGEDPTECGTACCVAGWAYYLTHEGTQADGVHERHGVPDPSPAGWPAQHKTAQAVLGLTVAEACVLFAESWPVEWWQQAGIDHDVEQSEIHERRAEGLPACKIPNADEAIAILSMIADTGRFPDTEPTNRYWNTR